LVVSQLLTLFITPVIYLYFERLHHWYSERRATAPQPADPHAGPHATEPAIATGD
jgi:HAE1 family hydrophobic/amphiphilic exporter-1